MKKSKIAIISLSLLCLLITCISIIIFDDIIPLHFGIDGKPDNYGSKYFLLLFPLFSILMSIIILNVSKSTKLSDNYKKYFLITGILTEIIFMILQIVISVYTFLSIEEIPQFDISKILMVIIGLMLIVLSNFMPKIEKNRTLGVRTKWSMYNEITWQKTHRFTGFLGAIIGSIILVSGLIFKETINFIILITSIIVFVLFTSIASYHYYKEEKNKEKQ